MRSRSNVQKRTYAVPGKRSALEVFRNYRKLDPARRPGGPLWILFDFNKADVKAESAPTLAEIAKLLKSGPGLKLLVAGHTDSVGGFEFNRDLSARRANAAVTELTGKYGISNDRLFPFGPSSTV